MPLGVVQRQNRLPVRRVVGADEEVVEHPVRDCVHVPIQIPSGRESCEPLERRVSGPQGPVEPRQSAATPIDPNVRIGHVHLRTADIDRVRDFYVGVLGFDVVSEARDVRVGGRPATSCSSRPAAITTTSASTRGSPPAAGRSPTAWPASTTSRCNFPTQAALADVVRRLVGRRLAAAPAHGSRHAPRRLPHRPRRQRPRARLGPAGRGVAVDSRPRARTTSSSTTCSRTQRPGNEPGPRRTVAPLDGPPRAGHLGSPEREPLPQCAQPTSAPCTRGRRSGVRAVSVG